MEMAFSSQCYPPDFSCTVSLSPKDESHGRKPLEILDTSVLKAKQYSLEGEPSSLSAPGALFQAPLSIQERHIHPLLLSVTPCKKLLYVIFSSLSH